MKNTYKYYIAAAIVIILGFLGVVGANYIKYQNDLESKESNLSNTQNIGEAYFAGGCFWCVESGFEKYKDEGVIDVVSGYAGGNTVNPTYKEVGTGNTGHREAVKVLYDTSKISYEDLLKIFWRLVNPTDNDGQYVDRGFPYTTAIFYQTSEEKEAAEASKNQLSSSGRYDLELVTPIIPYSNFYDAEDYHQDFYIKSPLRYNTYTNASGRKEYLSSIWGDDVHYDIVK
ncbi:peptide-methionine (S)-S-oxide reductase MsrA [Candidatus Gracilibacteria bacterium]|nr:peptide-methionine (S)-S-oxide reductase MsrA [Candidatus Gracilibacteria bacterium]